MKRRTFFSTLAVTLSPLTGQSVRDLGLAGDGRQDESAALQQALETAQGILFFPTGVYRLTRTVRLDLDRHGPLALAACGTARIVMEGEGPAFHLVGSHRGTAGPDTVTAAVWSSERFPTLDGLEIVGSHARADGLLLEGTLQATLTRLLIRTCRDGVRLSSRNRNTLISNCHIYDNREAGVRFERVNLHQAIIADSHISYNKKAGIFIDGGEVRNLQIAGNDIEYNYQDGRAGSADILIDVREGNSTFREGTIAGNTIQASPSPEGANIRIMGGPGFRNTGLIAVTGNMIGSQTDNIVLDQCRAVTVTGNTLYAAARHSLRLENCASVSIADNTIDSVVHREAWDRWRDADPAGRPRDGILVRGSRGVQLSGLVLSSCLQGSEQAGGAVEVENSRDVSVVSCQILEPQYRGIVLSGAERCHVQNCTVADDKDQPTLLEPVQVLGPSRDNLLQGNIFAGKEQSFGSAAESRNNLWLG